MSAPEYGKDNNTMNSVDEQPDSAPEGKAPKSGEGNRIAWLLVIGMFLGACLVAWSQATYSACEDPRYPDFLNVQNCDTSLKWMLFVLGGLGVSYAVLRFGMHWSEKNNKPKWKSAAAFPALLLLVGLMFFSQMYLF